MTTPEQDYWNPSEDEEFLKLSEKTRSTILELVRAMELVEYSPMRVLVGVGRFNDNGDRETEIEFWNYYNCRDNDPSTTAIKVKI